MKTTAISFMKQRERSKSKWTSGLRSFCIETCEVKDEQLIASELSEQIFNMFVKELIIDWINYNKDDYFEYTMSLDVDRESMSELVVSLINKKENVVDHLVWAFGDHVVSLAKEYAELNSDDLIYEIRKYQ